MCDVSYYMCKGHSHTHETCKAINIASNTLKRQLHVGCYVCKLCVHSLLPHTVMNPWYDVVVLGEYLMQEGGTPLYVASQNGHRETVEVLLDHSADVHARTKVCNCMQWRFCLPSLRLCVHAYCTSGLTLVSSVSLSVWLLAALTSVLAAFVVELFTCLTAYFAGFQVAYTAYWDLFARVEFDRDLVLVLLLMSSLSRWFHRKLRKTWVRG